MGDRGNVILKYEDGNKIYFYTHWTGSDLPDIVKNALIRGKERWNDESYLARIVFSEMIQGSILDLTGFGIAPYEVDNENELVELDLKDKTVTIGSKTQSFENFVKD